MVFTFLRGGQNAQGFDSKLLLRLDPDSKLLGTLPQPLPCLGAPSVPTEDGPFMAGFVGAECPFKPYDGTFKKAGGEQPTSTVVARIFLGFDLERCSEPTYFSMLLSAP